MDRSAGAEVRLHGMRFADPERQKDIALYVDGESVPLVQAPGSKGLQFSAELPATEPRAGAILTFVLPVVLPPNTTDTPRWLGFAFTRLSVTAHPVATQEAPKPAPKHDEGTVVEMRRTKKSATPAATTLERNE
ncbi:MAG: hypothetical protein ACREML_02760 [Vulcanimicrobiaceae bacterium]